jgi:hypothetical protein
MKKALTLSTLLFPGIVIIAQEIDLSKFTVPEYHRNELEFNLSNSNRGSVNNIESEDVTIQQDNKSLSISNSTNVSFRTYSNSKSYQGYLLTDLDLSFPWLSNGTINYLTSEQNSKSRNSSLNFVLNSSNRFYFGSQWYFEIKPDINLNSRASHRESRWDDTVRFSNTRQDYSDFSVSLGSDFRYGKGRVEPVEDLRQVVYILSDLQKAGRLKREITQDEAMMLAEKLSALKNRRFLDARLRLIEEMIEIEKIMIEMDMITDNDAAYFSTVNDYWSMTSNPFRSHGKRLSLGVYPSYNYNDSKSANSIIRFNPDTVISSETHIGQNGYSVNLSARYEQFKPVNLYWQQDYSAELFTDFLGRKNEDWISETHYSTNMIVMGMTGNYSLKYYPNSRTSYSGNAGLTYQNGNGKEEDFLAKPDVKYKYFRANLGLSAGYYFSPQLTVNGSVGLTYMNQFNTTLYYNHSIYPQSNEASLYLSLGLLYKLF